MVDTTTDSGASPDTGRMKIPLWYSIFVCLGSAGVGGFFGASHEVIGIIFGAIGGVGVAVFWLRCVSTLRQRPIVRIIGGIALGVAAGLLDTFWLHATAWGLGYETLSGGELPIDLIAALVFGSIYGVVAGASYGLVCMIILEIHLACSERRRET